ncbi:MAG: hypothetical protein KA105_01490 [Caulobacter sp.]|nr:hypothetical protein [Caulobacter sp.]
MMESARLLLMLGLTGTAVTFLGSFALWWMNDERRIRRALRRVLRAEPEAVVIAHGRGRGAGFSFATNLAAVAWDKGAWCLVYRIDELSGAELVVDGQVVARAFRSEPRRALEQAVSSANQVTLRLIFDDPRYPDFELDLWLEGDERRRDDWSPRSAIAEGNRWLARAEAILRRPGRPRVTPEPVVAAAPPPASPPPPPPPPPSPPPPPEPLEPVYVPKPARTLPTEPPPEPARARKARRQPPPWEDEPEFDFGPGGDEEDRP